LVATAWGGFFADGGVWAAGVGAGLLLAAGSAFVCVRTLRLESKVTTATIVGK
jgi:hypothetical protein